MPRPLRFNAFVMNTASHIHHGQWRREDAGQVDFEDVGTWIRLARILEDAKFDAVFFADVSGVYGDADADFDVYLRQGLQVPSNDPAVLLGALATHTEHLGLAYTSSVLQSHPFQFARQISTLDHISKGRVAWNIVTGLQDNGARNFGQQRQTDHAERYRWAEEYVDLTYKLWEGSWDDDALVKDREAGVYAEPSKVHKIDHVSERYSVQGPHLVAPSPQRTPVLYQAGSSASGRAFAAKNAEATFIVAPNPAIAAAQIAETRALAVEHGREPGDITFYQGLSFVIGRTEEEAQAKAAEHDRFVSVEGYLAHLSFTRPDGRVYDPKTPLSEVDTDTARGFIDVVSAAITDRPPLVEDVAWLLARGTRVIGTPEQIADRLEEWQAAGVDGIFVTGWVLPGSFTDFADLVLPVLRARGLAQEEYRPGTLREKLTGSARLDDRHPAAAYRGAFSRADRSEVATPAQ